MVITEPTHDIFQRMTKLLVKLQNKKYKRYRLKETEKQKSKIKNHLYKLFLTGGPPVVREEIVHDENVYNYC